LWWLVCPTAGTEIFFLLDFEPFKKKKPVLKEKVEFFFFIFSLEFLAL